MKRGNTMELLDSTFTAQSLANASGCDVRKISDWASRGVLASSEGGGVQGRGRKFSWFAVMEAAIANELMDMGLSSVTDAFTAASRFALIGEGFAGYVGETMPGELRAPGLPWHPKRGLTYLFVWKDGGKVKLTGFDGDVKLADLTPDYHRATGFMVVNVSEVFSRVCKRMGLDHRSVLDEAYPGEAIA